MSEQGYGPDLRIPIGWMFLILGLILTGYGFLEPGARAPWIHLNINGLWGMVLLLFAVVMLVLGYVAERRSRRRVKAAGGQSAAASR